MSAAFRCDRCSRLFNGYPNVVRIHRPSENLRETMRELCDECMTAIGDHLTSTT